MHPMTSELAIKFFGSKHRCNRAKAIIALSETEKDAISNLQRYGYTRAWRERAMFSFKQYVNTPTFSGVPFSETDTPYWQCMPIVTADTPPPTPPIRRFDLQLNPTTRVIETGVKISNEEYSAHAVDADGSEPLFYAHYFVEGTEVTPFYVGPDGVWDGTILSPNQDWYNQLGETKVGVAAFFNEEEEPLISDEIIISKVGSVAPTLVSCTDTTSTPAFSPFIIEVVATEVTDYQWYQIIEPDFKAIEVVGETENTLKIPCDVPEKSYTYQCCLKNKGTSLWTSFINIFVQRAVPELTVDLDPELFYEPNGYFFEEFSAEHFEIASLVNSKGDTLCSTKPPSSYLTFAIDGIYSKGDRDTAQIQLTDTSGQSVVVGKMSQLVFQEVPVITKQPTHIECTIGKPFSFSLVTEDQGTFISETYSWERSIDKGVNFTKIEGATTTTYSGTAESLSMTGEKYRCKITNQLGVTTSEDVRLTVIEVVPDPIIVNDLDPLIYTRRGETLTQTVKVINYTSLDLMLKGAVVATINYPEDTFNYTHGLEKGTRENLTLVAHGTNDITGISSTVIVQSNPTIIITLDTETHCNVGDTIHLSVVMDNQGTYMTESYQWQWQEDLVTGYIDVEGATELEYIVANTPLSHDLTYFRIVCTNNLGVTTSSPTKFFVKEKLPGLWEDTNAWDDKSVWTD